MTEKFAFWGNYLSAAMHKKIISFQIVLQRQEANFFEKWHHKEWVKNEHNRAIFQRIDKQPEKAAGLNQIYCSLSNLNEAMFTNMSLVVV